MTKSIRFRISFSPLPSLPRKKSLNFIFKVLVVTPQEKLAHASMLRLSEETLYRRQPVAHQLTGFIQECCSS